MPRVRLGSWAPGWRTALACAIGLGGVAALTAACWRAVGPVLFDGTVSAWLTPGPRAFARHAAQGFVDIASPATQIVAGAVVAGVVLLLSRSVPWALVCLLGPALAGVAEIVMKPVVDRTRTGVGQGLVYFPSGHTTGISSRAAAMVLVAFAASSSPAVRALVVSAAVAASLAMAASVVALHDHYATDAVAGLLLGSSSTLLVAWILIGRRRTP